MKNLINDVKVDVVAFHKKGLTNPKKMRMSYKEFLKLKHEKYHYRAYKINFNTTIFLKDEIY
jgi:hypothetical protein